MEFVGSQSLGGQRMVINAEVDDSEVTGQARFTPAETEVTFECADTDTHGVVIVAGEVTTASSDGDEPVGLRAAVIIREGDPDSAVIWFDDPAPNGAGSCDELLESIPENHRTDSDVFFDVEAGDNIETG